MIVATVALVFAFAMFAFVIVAAIAAAVAMRRRSIVPAGVRRRLNRDLERALEEKEIAEIKREWMKADGWELADE